MSHLDDESVAKLAVGDSAEASVAQHVDQCSECAERVVAMSSLADRIGALGRHPARLAPPDGVWGSIVAELGDELAAPPAPGPALSHATEDDNVGVDTGVLGEADVLAFQPKSEALPLRRVWLVGVAAGIVGLVAGAGIVAGLLRDPAVSGTVVASAAMTDLATEDSVGSARVEVLADGTEVLVLDTEFQDPADGYLEVWLIDPNIEGMVSLGHLTQAQETFVIPDGFEVAAFPIVDISVEMLDGVPTHSGDSVTRGILES